MRKFSYKKQELNPAQIFYDMMNDISDMVDLYDSVISEDESEEQDSQEPVYNYVMKNENGLVKIGISKDVDFRRKTLECVGGYFITDIYSTLSIQKAINVESQLHDYFANSRKVGEWFEIDYDLAVKKTQDFSKVKLENHDNNTVKEKLDTYRRIKMLSILNQINQSDEDGIDFLVLTLALRTKDVQRIKLLINSYITKYVTEGAEEIYNLFALYLLLYLKESFSINKVALSNGCQCFISGHTVCIEEDDFCETMDFYQTVYEMTQKF